MSLRKLLPLLLMVVAGVSLYSLAFLTNTSVSDRGSRAGVNWHPFNSTTPCIDTLASAYNRVEDIYCVKLPPFLPHLKNPCFYERHEGLTLVLQCLPYFFIIGMDKCGTTDLHSRIASHPSVLNNRGSLNKETSFWSWYRYGIFNYRDRPPKLYMHNYLEFFNDTAFKIREDHNASQIITGDATPMDFWDFRHWHLIPQNAGKDEPEVITPDFIRYLYQDRPQPPKLLLQFREPIERLYSDYVFLQQGNNPNTFHAHVVKAMLIFKDCLKARSQRFCFFDKDIYKQMPTRLHLGCYSVYLKEWLRVFPLSAFHVTRTEDFQNNMKETLTDIFSFLELEPMTDQEVDRVISHKRKHVTTRKKGKILPETFSILKRFYLPCLQETASLLNDKRFLWEDVYELKFEKDN